MPQVPRPDPFSGWRSLTGGSISAFLGNKLLAPCLELRIKTGDLGKVLRAYLNGITTCEKLFGFEPEITAKVAKQKFRIYYVGISYSGRSYEEGKKLAGGIGFLKYN